MRRGWRRLAERLDQGEGLLRTRGQRLLMLGFVLTVAAIIAVMCWVLSRAVGSDAAFGNDPVTFTESRLAMPRISGVAVGPLERAVPLEGAASQFTVPSGSLVTVAEPASNTEPSSSNEAPGVGAAWELTARY